jgi:AmmeMemoRadiSam system protein A
VSLRGLAASSADVFRTPLGDVPLDRGAIAQALELPQVETLDEAHAHEHSLEVHLPFLQRVLGSFLLTPLVVGEASPDQVAEVLELLWGGPETLIVISSDLSHYYDYAAARRMDTETARAIETLDPRGLGAESACGRVPVRGLLLAAQRRGLGVTCLDLRSSGDTAGPRDQVVGYGAWAFSEPPGARVASGAGVPVARLGDDLRAILFDVAVRSIECGLEEGRPLSVDPADWPEPVREQRASFVTLRRDGELRGCTGSIEPRLPLVADVAASAHSAAFRDPRFLPLGPSELRGLEVHISVLSRPEPLAVRSESDLLERLRPGVDGLILRDGQRMATFLPTVWESLTTPREFVRQLKLKAGLSADHWSADTTAARYTTEEWGKIVDPARR